MVGADFGTLPRNDSATLGNRVKRDPSLPVGIYSVRD
jgi:hypothetical protein